MNSMVFTSRFRRAYVQKRSRKEMVVATLLLLGVIASCGLACKEEEREQQVLSADFNSDRRSSIVASWTEQPSNFTPQGQR